LLAIGGGYDLGLIEALGVEGMANIKEYVSTGGSYLGICAGAYFACDSIEFDQGGPLEVVGERSLKFCSGIW
jgi:biotin--protein ligase